MKGYKTVFAAAALLAAGLVSTPALAQSSTMRASQELGFYAGAGLGQAKVDDFCSDARSLGFTSCDDKDRTWKVFGGYRFHPNVAVEAGYADLGKFKAGVGAVNVNARVRAFELLAVPIYPFGNGFSVYGKLGLARWDVEASARGFSANDEGTDFTFGLGAQYDFTPNLGARVEWQRYTDIDVNTVGISLVYMFR